MPMSASSKLGCSRSTVSYRSLASSYLPSCLQHPGQVIVEQCAIGVDLDHLFQAVNGLGIAIKIGDGVGQVSPEGQGIGLELGGASEPRRGFLRTAILPQSDADVGVGQSQVGFAPKRFDKTRDRLSEASQRAEGFAEPVVRLGMIGLECDSEPAMREGLFSPAEIEQKLAEVGPGAGQLGVELQGFAQVPDRRLDLSQRSQGDAQVGVCLGVVRAECQGGLEMFGRFGKLAQSV